MTSARPVYRVGISGSYGGLNLGDEAILQSIITQLRAELPVEITVFSRDSADTRRRHRVERAVPVRELSRDEILPEIERLDVLVLGGGGILFDAEARIYLREVTLALEREIPVMVYAVGVGPLNDPAAQKLVRRCLESAAVVTVRDRSGRHALEEIGLERGVLVTADPALLLEPEPLPSGTLEREGLEGQTRLVGVSVREPGVAAPNLSDDDYHGLLANAADYIVDRFDADVVFISMERQVMDMQHSHAVVARMLRAQRATVLKGEYTPGQMLTVVGHFDFVVGMRLHFLIFAALQGVPFVALPYASKVHGFLDEFSLNFPPLNLVNPGRLIAHIDQSWDRRRSLQNRISRTLPGLHLRARQSNAMLVDLLVSGRHAHDAAGIGR